MLLRKTRALAWRLDVERATGYGTGQVLVPLLIPSRIRIHYLGGKRKHRSNYPSKVRFLMQREA